MKDREWGDETLIAQVGVKGRELIGGAHRFVRHGAKRHRGDIGSQPRRPDRPFDAFARPVAPSLGICTRHGVSDGDHGLLDLRCGRAGQVAEGIGLERHRAPVDQVDLLGPTGLIEQPPRQTTLLMTVCPRGIRKEDDSDTKSAKGLNVDGGSLHPLAEEGVGNREQETRTVTGSVIRGDRPSMADTMQRCEGGVDNSSAGSPSSVSDETDPAGVVLEPRVVQACVTQGESLTLSIRPVPRHGRLHQKGSARSYLRHKRAPGGAALQTTALRRHPYRRPLRRHGRGRRVESPR